MSAEEKADEALPVWLSGSAAKEWRLRLAVQAGARATAVVGEHDGCLKLKVAAPPVEGAANAAIISFLALTLKLRRSQISIVLGEFAKRKLVAISPIAREPSLAKLVAGLKPS